MPGTVLAVSHTFFPFIEKDLIDHAMVIPAELCIMTTDGQQKR